MPSSIPMTRGNLSGCLMSICQSREKCALPENHDAVTSHPPTPRSYREDHLRQHPTHISNYSKMRGTVQDKEREGGRGVRLQERKNSLYINLSKTANRRPAVESFSSPVSGVPYPLPVSAVHVSPSHARKNPLPHAMNRSGTFQKCPMPNPHTLILNFFVFISFIPAQEADNTP